MDGAADSPTKGEILDQINEHGFMSYPRTETRSSRETSRTVPLVRLYSRSLPPPPSLPLRSTGYDIPISSLSFASTPRFRYSFARGKGRGERGGGEEKKKVINRARREITIISAFVPSGVYIDFCRREAVGIESRLWMDGYGDAKATFGTVIVITIGP